jgi:hypothetical protein
VIFNPQKTHLMLVSLMHDPPPLPLNMNGTPINLTEKLECLGLSISSTLSWREHLMRCVSAAARRLGALFRVARFFSPQQLLKIYRSGIRPCIEYASHVWGGSTSAWLLERVDRRARRLVRDLELTRELLPLAHRRSVADLTIFFKMFSKITSIEASSLIPAAPVRGRRTRADDRSHHLTLTAPWCRIERYSCSFIPRATRLWNKLPVDFFAEPLTINVFKKKINAHLQAQRA